MEFIKNDVLLWQFMLCKNINQYNNSLCKSSSDYEGAEICIGKLMRGRNNTSAHSQLNIVLTSTLTLNALLLCIVKQPNLELESAACVYFKFSGAWWVSAHPWGPRLSMHCETSRGEVFGESGTDYQYQSPERPLARSCSWRPHKFARAKKRSWPNANNEVLHVSVSSLVAFVRSRHATGGERACCVTRPNSGSEGDNSECCTNAVYFAYNYLDNKDNRPQKTCDWVYFEWIERDFFCSLH